MNDAEVINLSRRRCAADDCAHQARPRSIFCSDGCRTRTAEAEQNSSEYLDNAGIPGSQLP